MRKINPKLIAIGNRLMSDDGIAVCVAENIKNWAEDKGIRVIIGETDIGFCLQSIKENDFLIIMDATCYGLAPGSVTSCRIEDIDKDCLVPGYSQHGFSLHQLLRRYLKSIDGYMIGIEAAKVGFGFGISEDLQGRFLSICIEAKNKIEGILEELGYA